MRVAALGLILVLTSCSVFRDDAAEAEKAEALALGAEAYRDNCASCHGMDGKGTEAIPDTEQVGGPDLTLLTVRYGGDYPRKFVTHVIDGRLEIFAHGTRQMPLWGTQMDDPEAQSTLSAIVEHVETLQRAPDK